MKTTKTNLLGMTRDELSSFAVAIGGLPYRGEQLHSWLYGKAGTSFASMTDLGKAFRRRLAETAFVGGVIPIARCSSRRDGTIKYLFGLTDGLRIESVLIPPSPSFRKAETPADEEQQRFTLCISTQVGCLLDCAFCATGTMGYLRNLTSGEIVDQLLQIRRQTGKRITNIVFMGMGEPLLNYDAVMKAVHIMVHGVGIAARRITVSTAGRPDRIRQLGNEKLHFRLAVSLHSAVDETRARLMPIGRKFRLGELLEAIEYYHRQTKQTVTYEVILFNGVNDTESEVKRLIALARRVPSKINIIPYHSIAFTLPSGFAASLEPSPRMEEIVQQLRAAHLTVMLRSNAGDDIEAACGQLAVMASDTHPSGSIRRSTVIAV